MKRFLNGMKRVARSSSPLGSLRLLDFGRSSQSSLVSRFARVSPPVQPNRSNQSNSSNQLVRSSQFSQPARSNPSNQKSQSSSATVVSLVAVSDYSTSGGNSSRPSHTSLLQSAQVVKPPQKRSYHTGPPYSSRSNLNAAMEKLFLSYWNAKQSVSPLQKTTFLVRHVPVFLDLLSKQRGMHPIVLADVFVMASYMHLPKGVKFCLEMDRSVASFFGGTGQRSKIEFKLVDVYTQQLTPEALSRLRWGVEPGTGVQIWEVRCEGTLSYITAFRGTNSVGTSRDALLGREHGTGALANCARDEIGKGIVKDWLESGEVPLHKYLTKPNLFVIGHSLGGALAQDFTELVLEKTGRAPLAYFASAPGRGRPSSLLWKKFAGNFFYTRSAHDIVPRGGSYKWPGRVLEFNYFSAPLVPGLVNSKFDKYVLQHGCLISLSKLVAGAPLEFTMSEGTQLSHEISHLDEADFGPLGAELVDTLRPSLMKYPFTPTLIELIMKQLADYKLEKHFGSIQNERRGIVYGMFVHLAAELTASEFFASLYINQPCQTLEILLSTFHEFLLQPDVDSALRILFKQLESLVDIETPVFQQQLDSASSVRLARLVSRMKIAFKQQGIQYKH